MNLSDLNKTIPVALYHQLKESMRRKILSKEWKAGSRIPAESVICEMYGVSRITVRKAIEELKKEGYLERIQGKGTYVLKDSVEHKLSKFYSFSEELKKKGINETVHLINFDTIKADDFLKSRLSVVKGEDIYCIKRIRYIDTNAYALETSYIPKSICSGLTAQTVIENGLYKSLNAFGIYLDYAIEQFSAVNLSSDEASLLNAIPGEAAISLCRTTYSGVKIAEYCKSLVRGEFFSYSIELR